MTAGQFSVCGAHPWLADCRLVAGARPVGVPDCPESATLSTAVAQVNPLFRIYKYLPHEFELGALRLWIFSFSLTRLIGTGIHQDHGNYTASYVDEDRELRWRCHLTV